MIYKRLNVYFFCDYGDIESLLNYKSMLGFLSSILQNETFDEVVVAGDLNADPAKGTFFKYLESFVQSHSMDISDVKKLPHSSYTYISSNETCSTSWLDHVIVSEKSNIFNLDILYGCTFYDHIPLYFEIRVPSLIEFNPISYKSQDCSIAWNKVTNVHKETYLDVLEIFSLKIWDNVLNCNNSECHIENHKKSLENLYETIIDGIKTASEILPEYSFKSKKHHVAAWNEYCREKYAISREKYLIWHESGKIRSGENFLQMKIARKEFKNALKYCRKNEAIIKKSNVLKKFRASNKTLFWREIKRISGVKSNQIPYLDGESNPAKIS